MVEGTTVRWNEVSGISVAEITMDRITMAGMPVAWMTVAGTAVAEIKVTRKTVAGIVVKGTLRQ